MRIDPERFKELAADAIRLYEDLSHLTESLERYRETSEMIFEGIEAYYFWEEQRRVRQRQIEDLETRRSLIEQEFREVANRLREEGTPLNMWIGYGYYVIRLSEDGFELRPRPR